MLENIKKNPKSNFNKEPYLIQLLLFFIPRDINIKPNFYFKKL